MSPLTTHHPIVFTFSFFYAISLHFYLQYFGLGDTTVYHNVTARCDKLLHQMTNNSACLHHETLTSTQGVEVEAEPELKPVSKNNTRVLAKHPRTATPGREACS